jgi:hypothetical protein
MACPWKNQANEALAGCAIGGLALVSIDCKLAHFNCGFLPIGQIFMASQKSIKTVIRLL